MLRRRFFSRVLILLILLVGYTLTTSAQSPVFKIEDGDGAALLLVLDDGTITLPGAGTTTSGYVLTTDADGNATWQSAPSGGGLTLPFSGTTNTSGAAFSVENTAADGEGFVIPTAGAKGIRLGEVGNPGSTVSSSEANGFEVGGAGGNGLFVGRADEYGVYIAQGVLGGIRVGQASLNDGLRIDDAARAGVFVSEAGSGILMDRINAPGFTGIGTGTAGALKASAVNGHGIYLGVVAEDGMNIVRALGNAMRVDEARAGGVLLQQVGPLSTPTASTTTTTAFGVDGVDGYGLYVGNAENTGIRIEEVGLEGIFIGTVPSFGRAGYFGGDVTVTGLLSKGGGSFRIDHPLDPANKYLNHSFVESPDMKNVYDGTVTLDAAGEAWVDLPDYFEALNRDLRYQLTAVGAPAPGLHVAEPVRDNRFKVAGGTPGLTVSWQVTGVRQDPWAEAHRIQVEVDKPAEERGYYLHPEVYGQPAARSVVEVEKRRTRPPR